MLTIGSLRVQNSSQGLFPALTHAASKQYVLIGEGTHTVMMEKNRLQFFAAVQSFLEAR